MVQKIERFLFRYRNIAIILGLVLAAVGAGASVAQLARNQASAGVSTPMPIPLNNSQSNSPGVKGGPSTVAEDQTTSFSIALSQGQAQEQAAAPLPQATTQPLTGQETENLLSRLPTLEPQAGDEVDFRLPVQPIPPPRPGETVKEPFPPAPLAVQPPQAESGPLKVLRFSPEGEIPVAPFLSVTFNQPMVAVSTIAALKEQQVPVRIEPNLPGTWRWMGTRTLTFEYDSTLIDRLPKATEYHISVPAGTKSAAGNALEADVTWTFTTPPPKVVSTYPADAPQPRDPIFFIQFDQRIDQAAVLEHIRVSAGSQSIALTLVGEAELQEKEPWKSLLKNIPPGRWIAFRSQDLLPADSLVNVNIAAGTPSAEGPLVTKEVQTYSFRTYAALKIVEHGCYWNNNQCVPLVPMFIRFNNPIDSKTYDPSMLRIEPELPAASTNIYGETIQITGNTKGQTTYTVTVSGEIQDVFGQKLGKDARVTFKVGPAEPALYGQGGNFITVDPAAQKPAFSVYDINYPRLDVQIYRVQPADWIPFKQYFQNYQRTDVPVKVPGTQVLKKTLPVESSPDTLSEVDIDLSPYLDGKFGQFIVIVSPPRDLVKDSQNVIWQTVQAWVQVTQIGLDAFTDHSEMVAWTTSLKDGAPLSGVSIEAPQAGRQVVTGEDGTARFPIPNGAQYLVARQGADVAMLPRTSYAWGDESWNKRPVTDELRWYVFDDRQMYRPGEDVHFKGWLRRIGGKQDGDVGLVGSSLRALDYQVVDSQNNAIANGQVEINALGGFDLAISLPKQVNLGYTQLVLTVQGGLDGFGEFQRQYNHSFQIQEFRRPEFEVSARNETTGPYFGGGNATVAVAAKYYAGGPLPDAGVTWQVSSSPSHYNPPNWPDFTFGEWVPWWGGGRGVNEFYGPPNPYGETKVETFTGKTDANGEHFLRLDFSGSEIKPVSVVAQATVMDVNRQAWTGSTTLLVHPANLYIGLRSDAIFVNQGTPLKVQFIVVDLDGKPVSDRPVEIRAARLDWQYKDGNWQEVEVDPQTCTTGSAQEPGTCTFETPAGGSYRITGIVTDDQGRKNQSSLTRWVSGGKMPPARDVQQEAVTLVPDKESYQPGDVAHILVMSPFSPAEGLLTEYRNGLIATQRFQVKDGSTTLDIPIEERYLPNLQIQVDLNGSAPRTDDAGNALKDAPPRPAFATAQLSLSIPPAARTLALTVTPAQTELEPGGETSLAVTVKDARGQPVADAEMAVVIVDEAVLALSNYQLADPLQVFYANRPLDLLSLYARSSIILANPLELAQDRGARQLESPKNAVNAFGMGGAPAMPAAAPTMTVSLESRAADSSGSAVQGPSGEPIRVRLDFNPLAVFSPSVRTGADGTATLPVKLPDNLTRYRVMVVAVDSGGNNFGKAEANITARLALMVRPSAPRFLNFGDVFELPVVLQNQTASPMTVSVAVRGSNIEMTGETGVSVTIPARDRVEVRFPAAAKSPGTARFQFAAASAEGGYADAATVDLPVYTPATTEAFATYGVIDSGAVAQPIAAPGSVYTQFGGLEISTSSTALQALTDAVVYLVSYPYDCTEQIASRVLAVSALRDVLSAFNAAGLPAPQELEAAVQRDITELQGLQNEDGGFPYWRRGQVSIPFNTIHTAHALYRAKSKDFAVPADMQQRALDYLRQIENHYPTWYDANTRQTLSAYALYVRDLFGDKDTQKALRLIDQAGLDKLSLDAVGWLWPVLQGAPEASARLDEIHRLVGNKVVETAGAANFTTSYSEQNYLLLGSDRRTDAILLDALIKEDPQSDLVPKIVNGLMAHRTAGRWMNTQENVFVLLALDRYFNTLEAQTPDFVARVWLGETYAGSHEFKGRTTERSETAIPMPYLTDPSLGGGSTQDLILSKEGAGRMYYRVGLRYAPTDLKQPALDMGFVVSRVYEALDDPADVTQDAQGVWHIKAGARVRVRLTMVADNRRYHVALVDPLPAGLEIINPDLAVSGGLPPDQNPIPLESRRFWWWGPWYEHQNLRDERAEAFTSLLWEGVYQYTYTARATTPGQFVVPPAKAEEMYSPEVFGRSANDTVIVK